RTGAPETTSSHPHELLSAREIAEERAVERLRGVEQRVVDTLLRESRREPVDVLLDERPILRAERFRDDRYLLARLEVLEARRVFVVEADLLGIEHVKDDE